MGAGNEYLQEAAPWTAIKTDRDRAAVIVRTGLNLAALFARVSAPFIPFAAEKIAEALGEPYPGEWPSADGAAELSKLEPAAPSAPPRCCSRRSKTPRSPSGRSSSAGPRSRPEPLP